MNTTCLILNGIGRVLVDVENHTLSPATEGLSIRLWVLIQDSPRKATHRMQLLENAAAEYSKDDDPWFWDLRVPEAYQPCSCCLC